MDLLLGLHDDEPPPEGSVMLADLADDEGFNDGNVFGDEEEESAIMSQVGTTGHRVPPACIDVFFWSLSLSLSLSSFFFLSLLVVGLGICGPSARRRGGGRGSCAARATGSGTASGPGCAVFTRLGRAGHPVDRADA